MPPLPVIDDVYRVAINSHVETVPFTNVLHIQRTGGNTEAVATHVQDALITDDCVWDLISANMILDSIEVTPLDGITPTFELAVGESGHVSTTNNAPVQCALVTTWVTGARGKSHRGRTFWGGVAESHLESNRTKWKASDAGAFATAIDGTFTALNTDSYIFVVASYLLAKAFPITDRRINLYIGTIRNRAESQE